MQPEKPKSKSNWEQIVEQGGDMTMKTVSRIMVLKPGQFELHIETKEYQGWDRLDIRLYSFVAGEMRPTQKGVTISPHQVNEFMRILQEVVDESNISGQ